MARLPRNLLRHLETGAAGDTTSLFSGETEIENVGHLVHELDASAENRISRSSRERRILTAPEHALGDESDTPTVIFTRAYGKLWRVDAKSNLRTSFHFRLGEFCRPLSRVTEVERNAKGAAVLGVSSVRVGPTGGGRTTLRQRVLDRNFSSRAQRSVRVPAGWVVNHGVHETVDGHRRPKRVVAKAIASSSRL